LIFDRSNCHYALAMVLQVMPILGFSLNIEHEVGNFFAKYIAHLISYEILRCWLSEFAAHRWGGRVDARKKPRPSPSRAGPVSKRELHCVYGRATGSGHRVWAATELGRLAATPSFFPSSDLVPPEAATRLPPP
jgi:hypothetical protein